MFSTQRGKRSKVAIATTGEKSNACGGEGFGSRVKSLIDRFNSGAKQPGAAGLRRQRSRVSIRRNISLKKARQGLQQDSVAIEKGRASIRRSPSLRSTGGAKAGVARKSKVCVQLNHQQIPESGTTKSPEEVHVRTEKQQDAVDDGTERLQLELKLVELVRRQAKLQSKLQERLANRENQDHKIQRKITVSRAHSLLRKTLTRRPSQKRRLGGKNKEMLGDLSGTSRRQ